MASLALVEMQFRVAGGLTNSFGSAPTLVKDKLIAMVLRHIEVLDVVGCSVHARDAVSVGLFGNAILVGTGGVWGVSRREKDRGGMCEGRNGRTDG